MKAKGPALRLFIYFIFSFWFFSPHVVSESRSVEQAGAPNQKRERVKFRVYDPAYVQDLSSNLQNDTADIMLEYTTAYPGSKHLLVGVKFKNPADYIAGFDFEMIITPPNLADFSTLRIYVDSMDTCPVPDDTCWYFFPIRECLVLRGAVIEDWTFFESHGTPGDTTQFDCDTLRLFGLAFLGTFIPPQPNYVTLFKFGVDVSCVPDSLTNRDVKFNITGHLSDPYGEEVPLRAYPGEMTIWWSVPGDASNDSLVDLADVLFLVNYLYKNGPDPCVMEAADPNADCQVELGDILYLINFLFREGSLPAPGCAH
jgi:hypothetical protein